MTMEPAMELNSLTDEILIKIFVYLDFKTRHNRLPLVCLRWSNLVRSNELWKDVIVSPHEESPLCNSSISQAKVFYWCNRPHVRPHIQSLSLHRLGLEFDDFTPVGLGALFGICCSALKQLELSATRALLSDLSSLLCFFNIESLTLACVNPDPLHPFQEAELRCISALKKLTTLIFDVNLVLIPSRVQSTFLGLRRVSGSLSQLKCLRKLSVTGTGSTSLIVPYELVALKGLKELVVKNPLWAEVPEVVAGMPELISFEIREHLYFSQDLKFGHSAGHLKRLTELNLSGNRFERITSVLSNCIRLKRLLMNGCGLQRIPVQIANLRNLEHLDVSNNPITSSEGFSVLLKKEKFVSLVFKQEKWTSELVSAACRIARTWGRHEPVVN